MSRIIAALVAALVAALALFATVPAPVAGTPTPAPMAACQEEDGSTPGQVFPCRWDAAHQGNGQGQSYVLPMPICSTDEVAAADAAHAAGRTLTLHCDDAESLIGGRS